MPHTSYDLADIGDTGTRQMIFDILDRTPYEVKLRYPQSMVPLAFILFFINEIEKLSEVIEEIAERLAHGEQGITGVMMESFLVGGHQKPAPLDQLVYGQSVTDSCVPWERTNELLHTLADAVTARRSAK